MQRKGKAVFITGGAGYIGTHVAKFFLAKRFNVFVFDDFSSGFLEPLERLKKNYKQLSWIKGDIRKKNELARALRRAAPGLVIHLAARCSVDESMEKPKIYFDVNLKGTENLLECMGEQKLSKLIFSSTCAVYGNTGGKAVKENRALKPVNVYGKTKMLAEREIEFSGLDYVIFRFFNVCGADNSGEIGDSKKPSVLLVQNAVLGAMGLNKFELTCPKVNTPDGTPIRDYIDVEDLARAHFLAHEHLRGKGGSLTLNLGNSKGYSVKQIISAVEKTLGSKIKVKRGRVRKGEYAKIFADAEKAKIRLGFTPKKNLKNSIFTLQKWYQKHPNGYSR